MYFLFVIPEIIGNSVTFILPQVPLGNLTHSPMLQSGVIFREGWALMAAASLHNFAIMGEKSFTTLFKPLTVMFQSLTTAPSLLPLNYPYLGRISKTSCWLCQNTTFCNLSVNLMKLRSDSRVENGFVWCWTLSDAEHLFSWLKHWLLCTELLRMVNTSFSIYGNLWVSGPTGSAVGVTEGQSSVRH